MVAGREFKLRAFTARLRGFLGCHSYDHEFDAEVQQHLQLLTERYVAQGMSGGRGRHRGAAAIACWIPARRAARVDPMVALRYQ